ncbi:MAG: SEC-C metal-binding domain-containing protein [Candidatus Sulfobium sp.]
MRFLKNIGSFFRTEEDKMPAQKVGRNDACWCGSGKKYKKCHLVEDEKKMARKYASNCGSS